MSNSRHDSLTPPLAFISYARADGEQFANELREKLLRLEPHISLWQDRKNLDGGIGWWKQITEALDQVRFLVIVVTPSAFTSEIASKEWRYARQQGVTICPVFGHSLTNRDMDVLPKWVLKTHIYDIEREWDTFVSFLKSAPRANRVPFMASDLRDGFVPRPVEFAALLSNLLDSSQLNPLATTIALQGAGGFGKTTLAIALCNYDDVIGAFDDGILWATLGEAPKILEEVTKLYAALTGERPTFIDVDDASIQLAARLDQKNCLLVIDDVWDPNHLRAFLRGGKQCARLITTRHRDVVIESDAHQVIVDEMSEEQSISLLTARLISTPSNLDGIKKLVSDLGEWPLLLKLASSLWIERVARGESIDKAFEHVARTLEKRGVTGYDRHNAIERNDAVTRTIQVSLERLTPDDQQCFTELAIFPDDRQIPISAVSALWCIDEFEADDVLRRLDGAALLDFDLKSATIQVHDVLLKYLREMSTDTLEIHKRLVQDAWQNYYDLPDYYAWRYIGWHLLGAGHGEKLRSLLWDVEWLQAKLRACDVHALLQDFESINYDDDLRIVQDALRLSAHGLSRDPCQLPSQLMARLDPGVSDAVDSLLRQCANTGSKKRLVLQHSSLTHAGGSLISILKGHASAVEAIAMLPEDHKAISASADYTLRVWDLAAGQTIHVLEGHRAPVHCIAVSRDGKVAISGAEDRVLLCWDLVRGKPMSILRTHGAVLRVVLSADSRWAISATDDAVIRFWDLKSGQSRFLYKGLSHQLCALALTPCGQSVLVGAGDNNMICIDVETGKVIRTYEGHLNRIQSVAISSDGQRAVSGCVNGTLRLWNFETAQTLTVFEGHRSDVECVAITPDGTRVVSGSRDQTIRVWDMQTGLEQQLLEGHAGFVRSVAITRDGKQIVSASGDQTVRQWSLMSLLNDGSGENSVPRGDYQRGVPGQNLKAHPEPVRSVAISVDGSRALSSSRTSAPRVWAVSEDRVKGVLYGHTDLIRAMYLSPNGNRAITAGGSRDRTLRIWNTNTQEAVHILRGHGDGIKTIAVSWQAGRSLSLGSDRTLWLWDIENGKALRKLSAVTAEQLETYRNYGRVLSEEVESVVSLDVVDKPLPRDALIAITSDATWAVVGFTDKIYFWNLRDGSVRIETLEDFEITELSLSVDGRHVLIGCISGVVAIWDLTLATFTTVTAAFSDARVLDLAFSDDNNELVCASQDGWIYFWDTQSSCSSGMLEGLYSNIDDAIIAPNASIAYSVYGDTIAAFDIEHRSHIGSLSLDYGITALAVVPDGSQLAIGDEAGGIHFLRLET